MQSNSKYTTVENIIARLSLEIKDKPLEIDSIVQWCAECTIEVIGAPLAMHDYNKVEVVVNDYKGLLPCNVYRLMDVFDSGDRRISDYYNDGTHLLFNNYKAFGKNSKNQDVVYINYRGIAVDPKTGYPLILRGHELACMAWILTKLYRSDFLTGKIPQSVWRELKDDASIQCAAANNGMRHMSNDDMRDMMLMVHNAIPRMDQIPMYHLDGLE